MFLCRVESLHEIVVDADMIMVFKKLLDMHLGNGDLYIKQGTSLPNKTQSAGVMGSGSRISAGCG